MTQPHDGMDRTDAAPRGSDPPGAAAQPAIPAVRGSDLLLVVALTVGVLLALGTLIRAPAMTVELVAAALLVQSAVPLAAIWLVIVRGRGIGWRDLGLRPCPRRWYVQAVLIALLSVPLVGAVNYAVQGLTGEPFRTPQIDLVAPAGFTWRGLFGMLFVAGVVAPIVEELVFRGLLYGWLRRRAGVAAAVALSAAVFALAHGILVLVPALAVMGAILALVYERSRSLWPPIVLHGAFNATMVVALYAALARGIPLG